MTNRGPQYAPNSHEARVGGDLEEMVGHPGMERILAPLPFDKSHIQQKLFEGARSGLENAPIPTQGGLWWVTWAMRFCELQFLLTEPMWLRLEVVYDGRCPDIAAKGRELVDVMLCRGVRDAGPSPRRDDRLPGRFGTAGRSQVSYHRPQGWTDLLVLSRSRFRAKNRGFPLEFIDARKVSST